MYTCAYQDVCQSRFRLPRDLHHHYRRRRHHHHYHRCFMSYHSHSHQALTRT
jgi:hypothetical protein